MSHLSELAAIVGNSYCLQGDELQPLLIDWRGRYQGKARCAVKPATTSEVAAVVRYCYQHQLPLVPQGGNTGLCGGATPNESGDSVLICLERLNTIRNLDSANHTITVGAGTTLSQVKAAANAANKLFPLSLASEGSCQIGGNLSTNAGGVQVLRYGNTRELTLGLEVVLPNGDIWNGLRGLRKDNTGYDLKNLFIGAEGTLGIITGAVLKLFPKPTSQVTAWLDVPTATAAIELLAATQTCFGDNLTAFELISDVSLGLVLTHIANCRKPTSAPSPWSILCEISSQQDSFQTLSERLENFLDTHIDSGHITDGVIAQSELQTQTLWALRENISEAQKREGFSIKHDIALPVSVLPLFLSEMAHELENVYPGIRIVAFGHAGDGNLHYNLSHPGDSSDKGLCFLAHQHDINQRVHDRVSQHNGSISAEHGLGQLKREEIRRYKDPVEMQLMEAIKKTLDPQGLMNPGKVL
jgi:FAD/FMN-containing dehydrogenase